MDTQGPHFDTGLIDCRGRLTRLHKGGASPPKMPVDPASKGQIAQSVSTSKERNPNKRTRGAQSTILSTGLNTGFGSKSILGG
jgi:hypothetical protein